MYKSNLKRSDSDIPDVIYERRVVKYLPPEYAHMDFSEIIEIFSQIDKDRKGYITRDQLAEYFRSHSIPESNVDKWFQWFEGDVKGIITIEDVCTVLGIPMRKEYMQKVERQRSLINQGIIPVPVEAQNMFAAPPTAPKSILDDVEILHNNAIPQEMLNACVRLVKENSDDRLQESDIARILKEYMDLHYKKHWIIVVATSTIGAIVAHEPNAFIHFRYNNRLYLLYRIPDTNSL
ncbi:unnamed protein product [Hymenolepis diminuta]|uniref:EF-hand domain-containing protein n=1 Tax=Hymenolepis diminuta TaxID=6216 RepID=A0A564YHQ9_HYMDI|nr:unnamed protein product [Hymenolepis diminuta]